jgi:DNA-directed RNA polymerase specialized sigma subunit
MPVAGSDGVPFGQLLGYDEDGFAIVERSSELAPALRSLTARDRQILHMRFSEELSQQEIGRRIGVTQMQVSRILARLLRQLRCAFGQTPLEAARPSRQAAEPRLSA